MCGRLKWLGFLLLIFGMVLPINAVTNKYGLTGTIEAPDGTPLNGSFTIQLVRPSVVNTCSTPYQVVPLSLQPQVRKIVNGIIQNGTSMQILANPCLKPQMPYWIQIMDSSNNVIYSDNWWFPQVDEDNIDVGTMGQVSFSGPIVVAIPAAIVSVPAGAQTIAQPGSTFLSVNNLNVTGTLISANGISGDITGNAATATQLASTPTSCDTGYFSTGILANGNAICSDTFPAGSSFATLQITGGTSSYTSQGGYLNWNLTAGTGETDFVNAKGAGSGGFNFYNIIDGGSPSSGTLLASISSTGGGTISSPVMTASTSMTAPSFYGNLIGNANTATAFKNTPTGCNTTSYSTGITVNGNANCTTDTTNYNTNGYTTLRSGLIIEWGVTPALNGSTQTVTFPLKFPHSVFTVSAGTYGDTDRITYVTGFNQTYFTVGNNGSGANYASWVAFGY